MDLIIDQVVSNTFDPGATSARELNKKLHIKACYDAIWSNKLMGKFQLAIDQMDSLIFENPDIPWFYYEKYRLLDGMDAGNSRADSLVRWLLRNKPKDFSQIYELSHAIIESKYPDYDLAIEIADWAAEKSNYYFSTAFILDVKAEAYFKKGNLQKAIQIQNEAINLMLPYKSEIPEPLKSLQLRLMFYQKELK